MSAWCEKVEADHLAGREELDIQLFCTASNALRRMLMDLGLQSAMKDATPTLSEYLTGHAVPAEEPTEIEAEADEPDALPPQESDEIEDDDPEGEGPAPAPEPKRSPGELIPLWAGASLLVDGVDAGRFWIVRMEGDHRHPLEWRHGEVNARARAEVLREAGKL